MDYAFVGRWVTLQRGAAFRAAAVSRFTCVRVHCITQRREGTRITKKRAQAEKGLDVLIADT